MQLRELCVQFPPNRVLIEPSKLNLLAGQRYCLIGSSGCGKSSLFAQIYNQHKHEYKIALVSQNVTYDNTNNTVLEEALSNTIPQDVDHPERDIKRRSDYATRMLREVGFSAKRITEFHVAQLSQGWKQRLAVVCAILRQPDLLLLDEPNEGVDLKGIMYMERFIAKHTGDLIVIAVSHDPEFLSTVATDIIYIDADTKTLKQFAGGFESYMQREAERKLAMESRVDSAQRKKAQANKFIQKHGSDQSKQKQIKEKKEKMDRNAFYRDDGRRYKTHSLQKLDEKYVRLPQQAPDELKQAKQLNFKALSLEDTVKSDVVLISLESCDIGYDSVVVLHNVNVVIHGSSRIALVGANSSGKSTLLRALIGDTAAVQVSTSVQRRSNVAVSFVPQCEGDRLASKFANMTAAEYVIQQQVGIASNEHEARQYLGGFGLSGQLGVTKLANLSSGQRTRFAIAMGCVVRPHLLVLDEPTHALDMPARLALAEWIQSYPGALLVSSHDRKFLRDEAGFNELWTVQSSKVTCTKALVEDDDDEDNSEFQQVFDEYINNLLQLYLLVLH